jgi:hypothetical protein
VVIYSKCSLHSFDLTLMQAPKKKKTEKSAFPPAPHGWTPSSSDSSSSGYDKPFVAPTLYEHVPLGKHPEASSTPLLPSPELQALGSAAASISMVTPQRQPSDFAHIFTPTPDPVDQAFVKKLQAAADAQLSMFLPRSQLGDMSHEEILMAQDLASLQDMIIQYGKTHFDLRLKFVRDKLTAAVQAVEQIHSLLGRCALATATSDLPKQP